MKLKLKILLLIDLCHFFTVWAEIRPKTAKKIVRFGRLFFSFFWNYVTPRRRPFQQGRSALVIACWRNKQTNKIGVTDGFLAVVVAAKTPDEKAEAGTWTAGRGRAYFAAILAFRPIYPLPRFGDKDSTEKSVLNKPSILTVTFHRFDKAPNATKGWKKSAVVPELLKNKSFGRQRDTSNVLSAKLKPIWKREQFSNYLRARNYC